jgi:hypothetical protein
MVQVSHSMRSEKLENAGRSAKQNESPDKHSLLPYLPSIITPTRANNKNQTRPA